MNEAIRLIRAFFPESRAVVSQAQGIPWQPLLEAMTWAEWGEVRDLELAGSDADVYAELLARAGIAPRGRVVFVPEAEDARWLPRLPAPVICDAQALPRRLAELAAALHEGALFGGALHDSVFVYESGEALLLNHDARLWWARSKLRRPPPR
ncbi:MAG: hypothetical protein R3A79_15365 [Nannocystaceae bacterium]